MAISSLERDRLLFKLNERKEKKYKEKKLRKKFLEVFQKVNRENVYKFFDDQDNMTYYNILFWMCYLDKLCKASCGKKYSTYDVEKVILETFNFELTYRAAKTLDKLHKFIKKTKDKKIRSFPINGLLDSDTFTDYVKKSEEKNLMSDWEVMNL